MTQKNVAAKAAAPLDTILSALRMGEPADVLADARRTVGGMDQRPWEQLPSGVKSAIRADFRRLIEAGADEAALRAAGYAESIVRAARRDLGLGG